MGEVDTWTIFVCLCGSDPESDGGMVTADLEDGSVGAYFLTPLPHLVQPAFGTREKIGTLIPEYA